jgi:hypothetical protein
MMNRSKDRGGLNQGGPSDQETNRPQAQDDAPQGSQSGQPRRQERAQPPSRKPSAASGEPDELRGVSETEREAGTPDPRATTDWTQGEQP